MRFSAVVVVSFISVFALSLSFTAAVLAACIVERMPSEAAAPLTRHLGKDCTAQEREAQAVTAAELLAAFRSGKGVDLSGMVLTGDLMLDELPLVFVKTLDVLSPRVQDAILKQRLQQVRVISGPILIRNSLVRGRIATNLKEGYLVVKGPVTMTGTTFERSVDFSHAAFAGSVDFSEAVLLREGFFIRALFSQAARFEKTAFGVHSRFHKAVFSETVTFLRAGFNGLAEFLEVTFEKDASFSRTYFKLGTGFSASRFRGVLDFSEAMFEREAFFLFTVFEGDAYFRRTTFRALADFTDAEFMGVNDFAKVFFQIEPRFIRTKMSGTNQSPGGLHDPRFLYGIAAALLIFTILFVLFLRKG